MAGIGGADKSSTTPAGGSGSSDTAPAASRAARGLRLVTSTRHPATPGKQRLQLWLGGGSSALWLAQQAIATGAAECVLAVGFEQMPSGALKAYWTDRRERLHRFEETMSGVQGVDPDAPLAAQFFAWAGTVLYGHSADA